MKDIYLLIGGNMGDRISIFQHTIRQIGLKCGEIVLQSGLYETAAWGNTNQPDFLNQALKIESNLTPHELLEFILTIEKEMGRFRNIPFGPRTIDIDILFYGSKIVSEPGLDIPHPRMAARRFVLVPLNEIAPDFVHPVFKIPVKELLEICTDPLSVNKYEAIVNNKD
jgi:2-amino-4-hydroxy-6-hydroxymethyldihydropteridine diphosphokinase